MAALDLQEQEQLEALKAWWNENNKWLLGTLLAIFVTIGGWRGWQYYTHNQAAEAATLYQQFTVQIGSGDAKRVNDAAAAVIDKFPSTGYASRAALQAALVNEQQKDFGSAKKQLQWVVDNASEEGMKDVAHLRLAAVLLDETKFEDALKQLETPHSPSFDGLYADLRGDIYIAMGKNEDARSAYKLAFEKVDAKSMFRNLIQLKLDSLGGAK